MDTRENAVKVVEELRGMKFLGQKCKVSKRDNIESHGSSWLKGVLIVALQLCFI